MAMDKILTYHQTDDYSRFKYYEFNRTITDGKTLTTSIEAVDLTEFVPIIVSPDFRIIDGQNRFEVCKKLGLPITYVVYGGDPEFAMINLNSVVRQWRLEDWLKYYCGKGIPVYIKFRDYMEKYRQYGSNLSNSIAVFSQNSSDTKSFKQGKLIDKSEYFDTVFNYIKQLSLSQNIRTHKPFVVALMYFLIKYQNDEKKLGRLARKAIALPKFSRYQDYLQSFENLSWKAGEKKYQINL